MPFFNATDDFGEGLLASEERKWQKSLRRHAERYIPPDHTTLIPEFFPERKRSPHIPRHGLVDVNRIKSLWRTLDTGSDAERVDAMHIISNHGGHLVRKVLIDDQQYLFGRVQSQELTLASHKKPPVYWISIGNRILLSRPFEQLDAHDQLVLTRSITKSFAEHLSKKTDLVSAALAVMSDGTLFATHNTQESANMATAKECAEANLSVIVSQQKRNGAKVKKIFVYGALKNPDGTLSKRPTMIGMCMRCVEAVRRDMADDAEVTMYLAGDHHTMKLSSADTLADIIPGATVWRAPYSRLKEPSIFTFDEDTRLLESDYWLALIESTSLIVPSHVPQDMGIDDRIELPEMHDWLNATAQQKIAERKGSLDSIVVAAIEIHQPKGYDKYRYFVSSECRGNHDNAVTSAVITATNQAGIAIPRQPDAPYISRVIVTGYNADGSPLDLSAEAWDRVVKRIGGVSRLDETEIHALPFLPIYDAARCKTETIGHLIPTVYTGSKQLYQKNSGAELKGWASLLRDDSPTLTCEKVASR